MSDEDEDFDKVCAICNVRNGKHGYWNGTCPIKAGVIPSVNDVKATFFVDSGKTRTTKCDKNRNPGQYYK